MRLTGKTIMTALVATLALAACDAITSKQGGGAVAQTNQQQRFSVDTTLNELARNAQARAVLDRYLPGVMDGPHGAMAGGYTPRQIQAQMPNMLSQAQLAQMNTDLAAIR